MSATYSISNFPTESTRKTNIYSVLQSIPDNTQELIKPRDVRDAFLSTWANSAFKLTKVENNQIEYIGLDSGNPNNRDIKNKILIGKRSFTGIDIMNNELLNSDTDIFFYNTKSDSESQKTKIGILAGTNSNIESPYFEVIATASQYNFNITNPSGDLNLKSMTGSVILNNIPFPNEAPTDGDILTYKGVYPLGQLEWLPSIFSISTIGTMSEPTYIYGSDVTLNGFSLEFISDDLVPETIGGIQQGSSFSTGSFQGQNWPLSEVIRELLYPYVAPKLEINVSNVETGLPYGDIAFTSSVSITYSVTTFARKSSEDLFDIKVFEDALEILNIGSFSGSPGSSTFSNFNTITGTESVIYELSVKNEIDGFTLSSSATASFEFVKPFIMLSVPISDDNLDNDDVVNGGPSASEFIEGYLQNQGPSNEFSKSILPYEGTYSIIPIKIQPSFSPSYLYFAYPFEYDEIIGVMSSSSGFISSTQSFTYSTIPTEISLSPFDVYGNYRIYKTLNPVIISSGLDRFKLVFDYESITPKPFDIFINDIWEFSTMIKPIDTEVFNSNTEEIKISIISSSGNDYADSFNEIGNGSIFKVSYNGDFINYVINHVNEDILNPSLILEVSYIPGLSTSLPVNEGDKIRFQLLSL